MHDIVHDQDPQLYICFLEVIVYYCGHQIVI